MNEPPDSPDYVIHLLALPDDVPGAGDELARLAGAGQAKPGRGAGKQKAGAGDELAALAGAPAKK